MNTQINIQLSKIKVSNKPYSIHSFKNYIHIYINIYIYIIYSGTSTPGLEICSPFIPYTNCIRNYLLIPSIGIMQL